MVFFNEFASWHSGGLVVVVVVVGQCRWVKWDVSGDFLMGFVGAWLPKGRGRERKMKREK